MKWWNDFKFKVYLWGKLPHTRIECRSGKYITQYKERIMFADWYYGTGGWTEDLQEAKNRIDESLHKRVEKLTIMWTSIQEEKSVRYIKYP